MAKMFPDIEKTRIVFASKAEEQFYELCRKELPDPWRVYHSVTLSRFEKDGGLIDNEIDFVCYHPTLGAIVIEVKGGRIRYDSATSQFSTINRLGEEFQIKNPFQQALVWKSRFIRFLRLRNLKVPLSYGVCMPAVLEADFPMTSGIEPTLLIGREKMKNLEQTLRSIMTESNPEHYRQFDDLAGHLDRLLVGESFTTKLYLRDYLDTHEYKVKGVEHIHETLVTPIASSRRLGVEGEAGTGKTLLALLIAQHYRDRGHSVLFLSSNGLLNSFLKKQAGPGVELVAYPELASSYGINLLIPPSDFAGAKEDWIQYEGPEKLKRAIQQSDKRYDIVLCDEAQDVQPFWWEAIETLLKNDESRFYVFFDRSQGVFGSGGEVDFIPEDVLPVPAPYFPLVHNYRTTSEIAGFSRQFRTGTQILQSHSGRIGYIPELIVYENRNEAQALMARLFRKLFREEGLNPDELTLLSARNPAAKESLLYDTSEIARVGLHRLAMNKKDGGDWESIKAPRGKVAVSTIAAFKGMETPVGILLNVSEYNLPLDNPIMSSLVYVACTRAKHMLYIFVQKDDPKREVFEKALNTIKTSGALVIDGSHEEVELVGTVTHYNPQRLGWVAVEGQSRGSVMFFPYDVKKAELYNLKVGVRLKFRPKLEGNIMIASDLRLMA